MMKLLICLSLLVSTASALNCMVQAAADGALTSTACDAKFKKCFSPKATADKAEKDKILFGCGDCAARKTAAAAAGADYTNANDCEDCEGEECNAALKCFTTGSSKVESKGCTAVAATQCFMPKATTFTDFTGYSAEGKAFGFGCGDCAGRESDAQSTAANAAAATHCADCTGKECNKQLVMTAKSCYDYTWNGAEGKKMFEKKEAKACANLQKASEATKFVCSWPKAGLKEADQGLKFGCVACDEAAKKAGKCMECKTDKCNSASSLIGSVLVLLAAVCMLF